MKDTGENEQLMIDAAELDAQMEVIAYFTAQEMDADAFDSA